jgi:Fe-coproporphyrin III synthase
MGMIKQASLFLRRLKVSQKHSGSNGRANPLQLIRQGIPYYLNSAGYARNPMTIFLSINGKCNLRCRMCDIGTKAEDSQFFKNLAGEVGQDFPFERFKTLMDEVSHFKPYLGITTTEPFLYKNIFNAVDYANTKGIKSNVTTNGILVAKHVDDIIDSGMHKLTISIDGPAAIHNEMRGLKDGYERILEGLNALIERKKERNVNFPLIFISSFLADTNYRNAVEMMENLPLQGIERVNMKLMVFFTQEMAEKHNMVWGDKYPATPSCMPNDFVAPNIDINELFQQTSKLKERFSEKLILHFEPDKKMFEKFLFQPEEFIDSSKCVFPWFISQLTCDGDMIVYTRCFNKIFGNIMNQSFEEVWNGEPMREFRRDLQTHGRFPGCSRCDGVLYR